MEVSDLRVVEYMAKRVRRGGLSGRLLSGCP